jgi:hypothetical protein
VSEEPIEPTDPVALIRSRAAERFDGDAQSFDALWATLLDATEDERIDFLFALLDCYDEQQRAERDARMHKFVADTIAEAIRPKDSQP